MPTTARSLVRPSVRWSIKDDLDALVEVDYDSFAEPWTARDFKLALSDRHVKASTAYVDGEPAGYAVWWLPTKGRHRTEIHLLRMAVAPSRRRRGVGASLLREQLRHLAEGRLRSEAHCAVPMDDLATQLFMRATGWIADGILIDGGNEWIAFSFFGGWPLHGGRSQ